MKCIFCQIASKEVAKDFIFEDEDIMVFPDIVPLKPIHLLIIPKKHIHDFMSLEEDKLLLKIRKKIQDLVLDNDLKDKGFRIVVNGGGAQAVDHLHFHLTGPWGKHA